MINYDSILSAFDGKPTLLQWLKMVKKALDESVLVFFLQHLIQMTYLNFKESRI